MVYHRLKHHPERRVHKRVPVLTSLLEPITIKAPQLHIDKPVPGFMGNLSAGGMVIATFVALPENVELEISINIPGFHNVNLKGKVKKSVEKHGSFLITFGITEIPVAVRDHISKMAEDFEICLDRRILGVSDPCYSHKCAYHLLCTEDCKVK